MHHLRNHPFIPPFILTTTVLFILFKHNSLILFVNRTPRRIPFEHDGPIPLFFFYTLTAALFVQLFLSLLFQRLKFSPMLEYLTPFNPSIWLAKWCDILLA